MALNSNLTLRSLGNAIAREGWEVIASNLTMGNGIGVLFGRIKFIGTNTLVWGDVVGNFPNYESNYILPLLLFRTSGDLFLTAMVDTSGLIRVYNPDFSKIVTGADFHFQAIYVVKR